MDYKDLPSTHTEAIRRGEKYYFTGKPCKHGHISPRFVSGRKCKECAYIRNRKRTIEEDYWQDYGDDDYKKRKREYAKKHYLTYAHKKAFAKRRRLVKLARVATREGSEKIRRMTLESQIRTLDTGIKYEVDHIIPIVHEKVCGLHVPANVQILTKKQNRAKASRFDQDKQSKIQMQLLKKKPSEEG
jgi:hypothetical protein